MNCKVHTSAFEQKLHFIIFQNSTTQFVLVSSSYTYSLKGESTYLIFDALSYANLILENRNSVKRSKEEKME
jgi:hypothetical protein